MCSSTGRWKKGSACLALARNIARASRISFFAAEFHTLYKRELKAHDPVRVTLQLLDFDEKRLHFYMELRHAREGWIAATTEVSACT